MSNVPHYTTLRYPGIQLESPNKRKKEEESHWEKRNGTEVKPVVAVCKGSLWQCTEGTVSTFLPRRKYICFFTVLQHTWVFAICVIRHLSQRIGKVAADYVRIVPLLLAHILIVQ